MSEVQINIYSDTVSITIIVYIVSLVKIIQSSDNIYQNNNQYVIQRSIDLKPQSPNTLFKH